jgi:hypothetical protein
LVVWSFACVCAASVAFCLAEGVSSEKASDARKTLDSYP